MHRIDQIAYPVILAHRGASAYAPENTMSAFRLALEHGADGFELDAKLTADGQIVVIHDRTVDRTTGAHGAVSEMTLAQIKELDAGGCFSPRYAGESIPTLEEVFAELGSSTLINVEIKNYTSPLNALPDRIADLVIRFHLQEHILFSSFNWLSLLHIRRRLPGVPAAILTEEGKRGRLLRGWPGRLVTPSFIHPYYHDVTQAMLETEHRRGRRVNTWTVDDPDEMRKLYQIGIDGIITNNPLLARRVLEER